MAPYNSSTPDSAELSLGSMSVEIVYPGDARSRMWPWYAPAMRARSLALITFACLAGCLAGCKEEKTAPPQGTPPPPSSAAPSAAAKSLCDANVGISDAKVAQLLPASITGFCVQKGDAVRSWGDG